MSGAPTSMVEEAPEAKEDKIKPYAPVETVLGSIPASVGTVESEGRQMKQC